MRATVTNSTALKALILLAVLGTAYLVITNDVRSRKAACLNAAGIKAFEADEATAAITLLQEAVVLDPGNAEYHSNLARAYSSYPAEATELLQTDPSALYRLVLQEAGLAHALCPDNTTYAADFAYACMDYQSFGTAADLDTARKAWSGYLAAHRKNQDALRSCPNVHRMTLVGILAKLVEIEAGRGAREAAEQYLGELLAMNDVLAHDGTGYIGAFLDKKAPKLIALVQAI